MQTPFLKKLASRCVLPLLCAALLLGPMTGGARAVSAVTARLRPDFTIVIDGGERIFYSAAGQQVHPIEYEGTTYLPLRAIGELMGKNVDWNQAAKTATLSGVRTAAPVSGTKDTAAKAQDVSAEVRDDFTIVVDGAARTFADVNGRTVYPLLYQGSTYLPVRAIGELMGKSVSWDGKTNTVTLSGSLVTDADTFSGGGTAQPAGTLLSVEDAKAKALTHAGLTAGQVTFTEQKLDREGGRQVYDIEFYTADGREYDYEIDAVTGEIRSVDYDAESHAPPTGSGQTVISQDRAREIALAKVPGASAANVRKLKLDWDDGRPVYEVKIIVQNWEYELEIDAVSGKILEFESELLYD